jgi:hypothetical protein
MIITASEIIATIRFILLHKESFLGLNLGLKPILIRSWFAINLP